MNHHHRNGLLSFMVTDSFELCLHNRINITRINIIRVAAANGYREKQIEIAYMVRIYLHERGSSSSSSAGVVSVVGKKTLPKCCLLDWKNKKDHDTVK
jgi:hypothetical protein